MMWNQSRAAGTFALGTVSALMLSGCGNGAPTESGPSPSPTTTIGSAPQATGGADDPDDRTGQPPAQIYVGYWGNFGLDEDDAGPSLESIYEETHPWVELNLHSGDYVEQHDLLSLALMNGSGGYTVSAVDEGFTTGFMRDASSFVNLLDLGAGQYQDDYLPWKWGQMSTPDGSVVVGLGYDVGGLALCYRRDLLEAAGLPSDRDAVSAAVGDDWKDFVTFGEEYVAATGKSFIDSATPILNAAIMQLGTGQAYYDRTDRLDMDGIRPAFDIAIDVIESGISANIGTWYPEWNAGLSNGDFAAVLCPSWMLGSIEGQINRDTFEGQWDIADIPGPGGNWGGSFLTIPRQGSNYEQREAYRFIKWLIQPEQQLRIMRETGLLPAQVDLLRSPEISELTSDFFNDAPFGEIFAKTVLDIPVSVYYARNNNAIRTNVESVLNQVQNGDVALEDAWDAAVAAAEYADAG